MLFFFLFLSMQSLPLTWMFTQRTKLFCLGESSVQLWEFLLGFGWSGSWFISILYRNAGLGHWLLTEGLERSTSLKKIISHTLYYQWFSCFLIFFSVPRYILLVSYATKISLILNLFTSTFHLFQLTFFLLLHWEV